ncbi:hypothetical protein FSP39_007149 [Pinctada imbricata]|uniref:Uncharacterized protein n=1 Tax=Pinctada imbricata TaxID=66713 RepID=A0AA89BSW4_PINIB|nr:hypothetical protein FSP39_007149 [Pinctada imbricata]
MMCRMYSHVDRAVELGESDYDASFVVSAIGILHTVGNIVCGFIGDRNRVNKSCFYSVALWICGVALALVPLFKQLVGTGVLVGIYGLLSAATEALKMAIVVDIVGMTKLTDAYGLLMFLQGIANLTGPPVAGWLFDISGSYDHTFLTAGISLVVAGVLSMIPACGRKEVET